MSTFESADWPVKFCHICHFHTWTLVRKKFLLPKQRYMRTCTWNEIQGCPSQSLATFPDRFIWEKEAETFQDKWACRICHKSHDNTLSALATSDISRINCMLFKEMSENWTNLEVLPQRTSVSRLRLLHSLHVAGWREDYILYLTENFRFMCEHYCCSYCPALGCKDHKRMIKDRSHTR